MGPGAPWVAPAVPPAETMLPLAGPRADPWAPLPGPAGRPRPRRRAGFIVLGVVLLLLLLIGVWQSSGSGPAGSAGQVVAGDCLSREDTGNYRIADCDSARASLRVNARLDAASDAQDCEQVPSDGALRTASGVLCLDFLLARGDCVQLTGDDLGRTDCPPPGQNVGGAHRVLDVLPDTQDTGSCPGGTEQVLVHAAVREVVCLGPA